MDTNQINAEILSLWKKYKNKGEYFNKVPLLYPNGIKENPDILFIGMNPSSSEKFPIKYSKKYQKINVETFFDYSNLDDNYNQILDYEKKSREESGHFKSFEDFISCDDFFKYNQGKVTYETIDLIYIREKDQKKLNKFLKKNGDIKNDMLNLTNNLIYKINPKVIVICNANASDIFNLSYGANGLPFNYKKGVYYANIQDKKYPVFLTCMLRNGVIDKGSLKFLRWGVSKYLEEN